MSEIYEDYYKEITGKNGEIIKIETSVTPHFNFAYDVMDRLALENPDGTAMVHVSAEGARTVFSYADIKRLTDKAANAFMSLGINRHDSVMLLLKRRYEFWISILALHKIGAVAIPTSHMVSSEDIEERIKISGCKAVICVNSEHICKKVADAVDKFDVVKIAVGEKYEDFIEFSGLLEGAAANLFRITTDAEDDMLYYFTSGTSGSPKAVIHDFSYPIAHIYTAKKWHGIKKGGLHLTVADSGWAKTAWGKLYGQWFLGASILVYDYEQFYAADLLKLISEEGVNTFCAPPTVYKYLILEKINDFNLNNLCYVTTAGEPMPKEVSAKFTEKTGLVIREGFGQTETALQICTPEDGVQVPGSIGRPSPLYNIALLDDAGNLAKPGEEGEIVIIPDSERRPIGIFKGYLGDEKQYEEVWRGGVYHTKDKAIGDQKGNFFFLGRGDDVIKSSGYRIGPSEVEDILMKHPAVFECAVTGFPSKNRGNVVKASIILKKGYEASQKLITELQDFVKKRAAIYKYPRIIKFVDDLPRSSSGKISRAMIRKQDEANVG
ncbi:AMP-binding protein [Butyrivibrio sp. DSM 10294]|uniref:AMP-binding protein n=1 Tax=Butyrivibrio sp. DSM 10294 TaxID=2972457 RepID=UPI00234E8BDF|nr:AMP-binding protein [Butyrivibrio sp. DSM 10294]MDC7292262.1 AMP-binding protein [Butyrivibrio sp. DSM 10294]